MGNRANNPQADQIGITSGQNPKGDTNKLIQQQVFCDERKAKEQEKAR